MPITQPTPEEKGKRLEDLLREHDIEVLSEIEGTFPMDMRSIAASLKTEFMKRFQERDAIHSKHYARIEGEKVELLNGLEKVLRDLENGYVPHPGAVTVPDIIGDFVRRLIAKHTTSKPQGK